MTGETTRRRPLVVLSSDQMGQGDERLGRTLMNGFIHALTTQETLPEAVLLYNGGVRLAAEGSEALDDLRALADRGVEVLSCGTCVSFYELADTLGVGAVTNMPAIVERQLAADLVVRP